MMDADNDHITDAGAANVGFVGFVPYTTTGQDRRGSLLMNHLPRELLTQSVLSRYLDGSDLANFWCATMSMREMVVRRHSPRKLRSQRNSPLSMVEEILRIVRYRKALVTEGGTNDDREDGGGGSGGENDHSCRLRRMVFQAFEEAAATESGGASADANAGANVNAGASDREQQRSEHEHFCWKEFLRLSRRTFATLSAMDYCERVPHNLIWTGHLSVRNSNNQNQNNDNPILVMLVADPRRWSMKEIRLWRNATTISCGSGFASFRSSEAGSDSNSKSKSKSNPKPTIRADVVPHNFLPVGPNRGRLVGVTPADREKLCTLSQELNRTGMVARFSCTIPHAAGNTNSNISIADTNLESRNRGGQFTAKLVAFDQAQDRLDAVFRRNSEPGGIHLRDEQKAMRLPAWHAGGNSNGESDSHSETYSRNLDRCSLLCCWNHEFLWEDSRSFRMETSLALMDSMREYASTQSEMWLTETADDS